MVLKIIRLNYIMYLYIIWYLENLNLIFHLVAKASHKEGQFTCWYSYDGLEFETKNFSWIITNSEKRLVNNHGHFDPPHNALQATVVHDGNGPYYSILANTQWGKIPGRANAREAWFSYDGMEHNSEDFDWIVIDARSAP